MRSPWLDGVSMAALLALSVAVTIPNPATAQQSAHVDAAIPVPEAANVPPPSATPQDPPTVVAPAETSAANATPAQPTDAQPADAQPVSTGSVTPNPSSVEIKAEVAPQPDDAAIARAVPVPEPANVPPPTVKDIGTVQLAPADLAVAEKLRDLVAGKLDRFVDDKKERAALEQFYKARAYAPLWVEYGAPGSRMKAAIARLKAADADGLDAAAYATPDLKTLNNDPEAVAQAELKLTGSLLTFARDAQIGRVTSSRISPNMDFSPVAPDPAAVLGALAGAKDVAPVIDGFNPPHHGFKLLRAKLAELRGAPDDRIVRIPGGPVLKRGMKDKRVPLLRERLKVEGELADPTFDPAVVAAVMEFQRSKHMKATGRLDHATVDALNGRSRSRDIDSIVSNMERWRWLPRDLGAAYVMVNVPDFTLKLVRNDETLFRTRIVVGKANTPSPSFSAAIENVLVNPSWHVPQSIIYGEYLPAMERDPTVLQRMGLTMSRNRDGSLSVKQAPGAGNALGRIKFNFPNKFQVYLHDTPTKHLFAQERRAYSHGCMRVQNPHLFAEALLSVAMPEQHYTADRITRMYGSGEQWLRFKKTIPVHLTYMNAYVDETGKLVVREDIYGYDKRVQSALRGQYLAIAERSQKVTGGAHRRYAPRQVADGGPRPFWDRGAQPQRPATPWFFNPFYRDRSGL